ncbi:MAG TPA: ABC transporter permease [Acidimicrobiales bacterium]|nr:ABC transporter permease [Acidimicrobiales bacterium]HJM38267.1 ABC transporter permease [Acidimicrobiales bacterium]
MGIPKNKREWLGLIQPDLLMNLTLRDLRSKYKRSVLGWTWSVLNPLVAVVVYSAVFSIFLRIEPSVGDPSGLDSYAVFLLVTLLPWQFHVTSLTEANRSITANSSLITKIFFPRWVLPTSAVLARFLTLIVEMLVLLILIALWEGHNAFKWIPVVAALMILQLLFTIGLALMISAANVYFRDIQHFLMVALQPWMFLTPILYPLNLVPADKEFLGISYRTLYQLNPMVSWAKAYRNVLYDLRFPSLERWLAILSATFVVLYIGFKVFNRLEPRMAEEV